jgi:tetratricopeptide (TPR) repeat protein
MTWSRLALAAAVAFALGQLAPARGEPGSPKPDTQAPAAPSPWWSSEWSTRRSLEVGDATWGTGPFETAVAEVPTLGRASPEGTDLRLLGPDGKHVPFEVLACGPDDRCIIAWTATPKTTYTLYWGNPTAGPRPALKTVPTGGLLFEARDLGDAPSPSSWAEAQAQLSRGHLYGRMTSTSPQCGWNPFGPSERVIYSFTGWLRCPHDGSYTLATNSVDSSFAVIDSKVAVEWPGAHPAETRAYKTAEVELKAGLHRLEYVSAAHGHAACILAWQRPGEKRIHGIGPDALAGYRIARLGPAESRDGPLPDFEWSFVNDLGLEARPVTLVTFHALASGKTFGWDFADGTAGSEATVSHVYLEEGTFPVSLTVDGKTVAQRLVVRPRVGPAGIAYERRIADYAKVVQSYSAEKLSADACLEMGLVCHEGGAFDAAARGFRAALERGSLHLDGDDARWAERLFELDRDAGRVDLALAVCDLVAERAANAPASRPGTPETWRETAAAKALVWRATVLYEDRDRIDEATACCRAVLEKHRRAPTDSVRWAFIRSGELALARGDRDAARTILGEAETGAEWRKPSGDFEVSGGAHSIDFEEFLRQNDFESALHELDSWEWERPTVLLSGQTRHLRGRVALARKRYEHALLEFERALARDPRGSFADEALFFEAKAHEGLGKLDKARACYERLVRDFPESQLVPQAKEKLP